MLGMGRKPITDLTGQRFGRLVVLGLGDKRGRHYRWLCRCDCGAEKLIYRDALRGGLSRSCGCARSVEAAERRATRQPKPANPRLHGLSKTRAHRHWKAAKQRCFDPNAHNYRHYGGRGITMAPVWADSFPAFYAAMGECPEGHTLEREDFNKGYEPGNCRWATQAEQVKNTSRNIFVDHGGQRLCLKDYADLRGVSYGTLRSRVRNSGETPEEAATRLIERQNRRLNSGPEALASTETPRR